MHNSKHYKSPKCPETANELQIEGGTDVYTVLWYPSEQELDSEYARQRLEQSGYRPETSRRRRKT